MLIYSAMHSFLRFGSAIVLSLVLVASVLPASAQVERLSPVDRAEVADRPETSGVADRPRPGNTERRGKTSDRFQGVGRGVSGDDMMAILEGAAEAGQPLALWRLGQMYENGVGVEKDQVRAFGYFSRIANDYADTPPRSIEADIVALSFLKVGEYYRVGLPSAGIAANQAQSRAMLFHAATYFGNRDAQYRVGLLYLDDSELGKNTLQSARWLSLAAHKGHVGAQAVLGDLLFNGDGIPLQPVEGLMWLTLAHDGAGREDETWINELLTRAMSVASPELRLEAVNAANSVRGQLSVR